MPIAVANGDIFRVRFICSAGNQIAINVLHYIAGNNTGVGATMEDFAADMDTNFSQALADCVSDEAQYRGLDVARFLPSTSSAVVVTTNAQVGGLTGTLMPRQVCGLVSKLTDFGGRKNRGRCYIPFPPETANDTDGSPTNAYKALLDVFAAALPVVITSTDIMTAGTSDFTPVVYHDATGTGTPITSAVSRLKWATQRRRGDYGSSNAAPF